MRGAISCLYDTILQKCKLGGSTLLNVSRHYPISISFALVGWIAMIVLSSIPDVICIAGNSTAGEPPTCLQGDAYWTVSLLLGALLLMANEWALSGHHHIAGLHALMSSPGSASAGHRPISSCSPSPSCSFYLELSPTTRRLSASARLRCSRLAPSSSWHAPSRRRAQLRGYSFRSWAPLPGTSPRCFVWAALSQSFRRSSTTLRVSQWQGERAQPGESAPSHAALNIARSPSRLTVVAMLLSICEARATHAHTPGLSRLAPLAKQLHAHTPGLSRREPLGKSLHAHTPEL